MKIFEYDYWENQNYDHLLGYLYEICEYEGLKNLYTQRINDLVSITEEELNMILKKFSDMSIFVAQSKLIVEEVEDKMWCEYCPLWGLKETIEKDFLKIFKKESTKEILDETLEILIIGEVIKIHEDERYKPIIKKFSNESKRYQ